MDGTTHFTVVEASRRTGLPESTLRVAIQRRLLDVQRDRRSRRIFIPADSLAAYVGRRF